MYCKTCGAVIEDGTRFCPECGTDVGNTPDTAIRPNIVSGTDGRKPAKKTIVAMAVTAFILTIISTFLDYTAIISVQFGYLRDMGLGYIILHIIIPMVFNALIPIIVAGLFIYFCKHMKKKPVQTGIPMIISLAVSFLSHIFSYVFLRYSLNAVNLIFNGLYMLFSVLFIIFFMLAVSGKLQRNTGIALTVVFGSLMMLIQLIRMGGFNGPVYFVILSILGSLTGFAAALITIMAMVMIVQRATSPASQASSFNTYSQITKFCPNCGSRFTDDKQFCDRCGTALTRMAQPENATRAYDSANPQDAPSGGLGVLGFFFPLIGLILYLTWKDQYPLRAKSAGKGALAGFITSIVLSVLLVIVYLVLIFALAGSLSSMF